MRLICILAGLGCLALILFLVVTVLGAAELGSDEAAEGEG